MGVTIISYSPNEWISLHIYKYLKARKTLPLLICCSDILSNLCTVLYELSLIFEMFIFNLFADENDFRAGKIIHGKYPHKRGILPRVCGQEWIL